MHRAPSHAALGGRSSMGIQELVRKLMPREEGFFDLLERQAKIALAAAETLASFTESDRRADAVAEAVQKLEHEGDKLVHELEEALARTFVTPIDREDIHFLCTELDDVIDLTNTSARAFLLLGVDRPTKSMCEMMGLLAKATNELANALPNLRRHTYPELFAAKRRIREIEKECDRIYRNEVSRLFHSPEIDAKDLLREREILDDLEDATDRCERVADTLANLAVKHG
jgi:predicted phosphate transport protein (TIGR00153 family)